MEILIQSVHIYVPIEVYDSIAEPHHRHHRLAKRDIEVASLNQETIHVTAFLGMPQLVNRNDVRGDIRTAFDSSLKGTLYCQLPCKIILEGL